MAESAHKFSCDVTLYGQDATCNCGLPARRRALDSLFARLSAEGRALGDLMLGHGDPDESEQED